MIPSELGGWLLSSPIPAGFTLLSAEPSFRHDTEAEALPFLSYG